MASYEWSEGLYEAVSPLGTPPKWSPYPLPMTPVLAISTQSPLGAGSYLERCELLVAASATLAVSATIAEKHQAEAVNILAAGEVYSTGTAGIPDPRSGATAPAAITAVATLRAVRGDAGSDTPSACVYSTGGYVTSQAVRGPARYGGGTPELRIGIYTPNLYNGLWIGTADTSELYVIRALWRI